MTEDIKNRINDLADCFTGDGVPNIAYIEKGILDLNDIVNQAKNNEVLDLVSDRFSKKDAQNIINAWDWIPDGTHTVETAQVWVSQKLKPVIEGIRNKLNDH